MQAIADGKCRAEAKSASASTDSRRLLNNKRNLISIEWARDYNANSTSRTLCAVIIEITAIISLNL